MAPGYKRIVGILVVLAVIGAGLLLSPDAVIGRLRAVVFSPWFPAVLLGLYVIRPFLAWPITALSALVGFRYGVGLGFPIALVGAAISTFIPYTAVRYFEFDSGVLGLATEESERFFSATGGLRGMIAARIAPVPAEATSLAAGAAHVPPSRFVLGTVIGEIPWALAAVTIGHSMRQLSVADVSFNPWLIVATAIAALFVVAGPVYRIVRRYRGGHDDGTSPGSGDTSLDK